MTEADRPVVLISINPDAYGCEYETFPGVGEPIVAEIDWGRYYKGGWEESAEADGEDAVLSAYNGVLAELNERENKDAYNKLTLWLDQVREEFGQEATMDPDATLADLRDAILELREAETEDALLQDNPKSSIGDCEDAADTVSSTARRAAELAEALVEWLDKGGALPEAWRQTR